MFTNTILVSHTVGVTVTAGSTATFHSTLWAVGMGQRTKCGRGRQHRQHRQRNRRPAFSNPILDDYHITLTTTALNNGVTTGIAYDIDDASRSADPPDLGAYEYKPGLLLYIKTESGGDIDVGEADGSYENKHGSFFWNGSQWVTNDTAAHMYFWNRRDGGTRIKSYTLLRTIDGSTGTLWNQAGYTVTHTPYTYRVGTTDGGPPSSIKLSNITSRRRQGKCSSCVRVATGRALTAHTWISMCKRPSLIPSPSAEIPYGISTACRRTGGTANKQNGGTRRHSTHQQCP
jgi:hypothetical protein